jgi:hypothetical protein
MKDYDLRKMAEAKALALGLYPCDLNSFARAVCNAVIAAHEAKEEGKP